MTDWHIAQMNVGTALYPLDDPRISGFMNKLDEINALAEDSPGFVWRLQSEAGNATDIKVADDPLFIVNMSVWRDVESLFDFVYKSSHRLVMGKRREWFQRPTNDYQVLWWVAAGHEPSVEEGLERLRELEQIGPSSAAFTFKQSFPPPGEAEEAQDLEPECSG